VNDGLDGANLRMIEKSGQRRPYHRLAGKLAILFGHIASSAIAASGCDDDSRDFAGHGTLSPHVFGIQLWCICSDAWRNLPNPQIYLRLSKSTGQVCKSPERPIYCTATLAPDAILAILYAE
jgi:hypothetical protein